MRILARKACAAEETNRRLHSDIPQTPLPPGLQDKISLLQPYIEKSDDIVKRSFSAGRGLDIEAVAVYINAVIDKNMLNEDVLRPLMLADAEYDHSQSDPLKLFQEKIVHVGNIKSIDNLNSLVHHIYDGMLVLLFNGISTVLAVEIHGGEFRAVDEPPGERTIRGSREGFVEILDVNISMIRRRLRDPNLVVKKTVVGKRTRNQVAILYVEDIASPELVAELERRLDAIDIDGIVASGYIEQFIEDQPSAIFPQVWSSERPDKLTMKLLEGRIVIIPDGTPLALSMPSLFIEFMQASEDYYERTWVRHTRDC